MALRVEQNTVHFIGSGRSVAWLARLFRVQEVVSSNLTAPTIFPDLQKAKKYVGTLGTLPAAILACAFKRDL